MIWRLFAQLVGSKETELGAAEAARLDAEADAAVEKATAASERARADAMREVAWKMESELEAMSAQAEVGQTLFRFTSNRVTTRL